MKYEIGNEMRDGRTSRLGTYDSKDELLNALNKMIEDDMKKRNLNFASIDDPYVIFRSIFINEETLEPDEI